MTAASGGAGPKLREGDCQVPEGLYKISGLNPNSAFHLSMRVDYPNASDKKHATEDGRTNLGSDIFIHGGAASIGCVALGDPAIEELFVLVSKVGIGNIKIISMPYDFRVKAPAVKAGSPNWLPGVYAEMGREMLAFRHK